MAATAMLTRRAYSLVSFKTLDGEQRILEGVATTPTPDRIGDVIESAGAQFTTPLPLLWQHRADQPIGQVTLASVEPGGIRIRAQIAKAGITAEIDKAWALIHAGLVRGLSIGFRSLEAEPLNAKDPWGPMKFLKWEWLELSAVTIPANAEASITAIKSLDAPFLAASGESQSSSGVSDSPRRTSVRLGIPMKTYAERIAALEATRAAKAVELENIQTKASDEGRTKDESEREAFTSLKNELLAIDAELADLRELDKMNLKAAAPVAGNTPAAASASRGATPVISFHQQLPPGVGFARAVQAAVVARLDGISLLQAAKGMYPGDERLHAHVAHCMNLPTLIQQIKAAVPAGTTLNSTWAGVLVDPTNLASEFIEFLRPATIIGRLPLRRIPFNVRMIEQTNGGTGYWVGQGAPKPLTAFGFAAVTMPFTKVAAISVITEELARFSSPSAETLVRDGLRDALVERIDRDLLDPAEAGTANIQPASLTNGLTAQSSAGTSADNVRTDLANLVQALRAENLRGPIWLVMPDSLAVALAFMVNSLGQPEFPGMTADGGTINGLNVITSQYVANESGAGNMVVAIATNEVFLADDGGVRVDASREASLQMLDNPTNNSATATPTSMVSMWQTNSIALRAEREINWMKRRSTAVVYMDDVNWGSIGSP